MILKRFNKRHILLIILIFALIVLFLPIRVNYNFGATALVYPAKEWHLKKGQDDSFLSELHNFETNVISELKNYKFERGDIAEVQIKDGLTSDVSVDRDDTIAFLHSYYIKNEIIRLRNLREIEKAALNINITGEKQALIDQSTNEYEFAKQKFNLEQKKFDRQKILFADSVISEAEFEIHENKYNLAEINVQITQNKLISLQTGKKSEEIKYIHQKIDSYSKEIANLEHLKEQYYIKTPIDGIVSFNTIADGIITIRDTSHFILKIPVKVRNIQFLDLISAINFSIPGYKKQVNATYLSLDENVNLLANQQLVIARAVVMGKLNYIHHGMAVQCRVVCDKITLLEYLTREININF